MKMPTNNHVLLLWLSVMAACFILEWPALFRRAVHGVLDVPW